MNAATVNVPRAAAHCPFMPPLPPPPPARRELASLAGSHLVSSKIGHAMPRRPLLL